MKTKYYIKTLTLLTVFTILVSCSPGDKKTEKLPGNLPEVTVLDNLKQTGFVPTLENTIKDNKNIIYTPSFLYAWDKVRQALKGELIAGDSNSVDFKSLARSHSYQDALAVNDYSVNAEIRDGAIIASAYFNKALPFQVKLQKMTGPLLFGKTKVVAFGMEYFDEVLVKFCEILYYEDDNNFILKLIPKDRQQEIILVKGLGEITHLADALNQTTDLISAGKKQKSDPGQSWKYEFSHYDMFCVPEIKFDICTNYKELEGQNFTSNGKNHILQTAYQRTGFKLDENGAVVQSEAYAVADSMGAEPRKATPRKMVFDTAFYIILKQINKTNPYFVMKVENTELMTKR